MADNILDLELSCPVCLTTYRDPVSLGCGHCFCRQCITEALCHQREQSRSYTCPMCQAHYDDFPTLLKNFQLCSIVDNYVSMQKSSEDCQIWCGDCLDQPNKAVKTCVGCEVSLCQKHVERHRKREHILLEPTESVQHRKCPEHDKLLEYNCEQDNSCICVTCYIAGSHKGHNIMTLKQAHEKHAATLPETISALAASVAAFCKDIDDLKGGLATLKQNTVKLSKPIEDLRDTIMALVTVQFNEIVEAIAANQDKATSDITAIIKQMEDAKAEAEEALKELNLLSKQPDDLLFLQEFNRSAMIRQSPQINTVQVVDVEADKVMMENIDKETNDYIVRIAHYLSDIHNVLSDQTEEFVWSGMERNKVQKMAILGRSMQLEKLNLLFTGLNYVHCSYSAVVSNLSRTLTVTRTYNPDPRNLRLHVTFPPILQICNCSLPIVIPANVVRQSSSKVHCLVDVSMSNDWSMGVTDRLTQDRRYLRWKGNCLSYETESSLFLGRTKIKTLKMELDFDAKLLGFYDAGLKPERPILVYKCEDVFSRQIYVGFNLLDGSLSLS